MISLETALEIVRSGSRPRSKGAATSGGSRCSTSVPHPVPCLDCRAETRTMLRRALGADRVRTARSRSRRYTTFRIGGPADLFYEPADAGRAGAGGARRRASSAVPFFLLGLGANILVGDRGFRGLVIRNRGAATSNSPDDGTAARRERRGRLAGPDRGGDRARPFRAGALRRASPRPWAARSGRTSTSSRPPRRASGRCSSPRSPSRAEILTEEGERRTVDVDYFQFGYDDSILHHRRDVVLAATFRLRPGRPGRRCAAIVAGEPRVAPRSATRRSTPSRAPAPSSRRSRGSAPAG